MVTVAEVERTRSEYAQAQALADEAYAAVLATRPATTLVGSVVGADAQAPTAAAWALDVWVRRRETADALAIKYFNVTRVLEGS
jgi:hypothetical protein